jgi:hypothetical protein
VKAVRESGKYNCRLLTEADWFNSRLQQPLQAAAKVRDVRMLLESQNDSMEGADSLTHKEIPCLYGTRLGDLYKFRIFKCICMKSITMFFTFADI